MFDKLFIVDSAFCFTDQLEIVNGHKFKGTPYMCEFYDLIILEFSAEWRGREKLFNSIAYQMRHLEPVQVLQNAVMQSILYSGCMNVVQCLM